jgi:hypothetical protein
MKADLKEQWVAALRSGAYRQGYKVLRTSSNDYCCLGVLCNLVDPSGWLALGHEGFSTNCYQFSHEGKRAFACLPPALMMNSDIRFHELKILMKMNDSGSSFEEIADWIEANL